MNEDKRDICRSLIPALQKTRALTNLCNLLYYVDDDNEEWVVPVFEEPSGSVSTRMKIRVTGDSGIAMIRDILREF